MHQREMTAVAGGVQRRGGLGDVLAHDRDVADLAIALAELVVGEADAARVVRRFRLLQRAAVHARWRAIDRRAPTRAGRAAATASDEAARRDGVAEGVGRAAERAGGLIEVVLEQRGLGEHRPHRQLFVARQRRAQRGREHLRRFGAAAALERRAGAHQQRLQGRRRHARV